MIEKLFNRITRAALRFKWVTIGITILALVAGVFAVTQLKQELIPGIEFPQTVLLAFDPSASVEKLRDEVTIPLENAVQGIEGVVNVESTTSRGVAFLIVRNEFGLDQDAIREEIKTAVDSLTYPDGMEPPRLLTFSFADLPIASVSVSSPDLSLDELKTLVEQEIVPAIQQVPEVADIEVSGGQQLPGEKATPEQAASPTPTPTQEPTSTPTEAPTEVPTAIPTEVQSGEMKPSPAPPEPVALPESWIGAAGSQGMEIATTDDLTPEMVGGFASFAPQMLDDLTPEMLLAMPLDALAAIPQDYLAGLDPQLQDQLAQRTMAVEETPAPPEPVALPESWIGAAGSQGMEIATTDDLTPEMVGGFASFAPQMLDDLTPEMLLAMPLDALAAIPQDYLAGLDPQLQDQLTQRTASGEENPPQTNPETDPAELPQPWQAAGQAQGVDLLMPEDITPEILKGITSFAPQMLDMLTPVHLRRLTPEVLAWLPPEYITSLDADLQAELDRLAQPAGGLGHLAIVAAEEAAALAADAPELTGAWRQPPPEGSTGPAPTFETAADLITSGFADTAAEFLNLLVESGQPQAPQLLADLTPEVINWLAGNEDQFLENLSPATLRLLSPETLSALPEDFMSALDPDLQNELRGIAAGTVEVFLPTNTINRANGNPSLILSVFKDGEANTVSVSHATFNKLDELKVDHPGLRFDVIFEQASFIEESISGVTREGGLGAIFAVVVILIFLSGRVNGRYVLSWRSTLVTAVSIPLSVLMAFALFRWLPPAVHPLFDSLRTVTDSIPILGPLVTALQRLFPLDLTINIMTLSGMTVAVGRVVDDSIVVLENIYRHIQRGGGQKQSVLIGTRDVSIAIFASTATTVVVFLPIGLMGGLVGEFFLPFGVAVTYALASSFLVAITVVPLLAYLFIRKEHLPPEGETPVQRGYTPILAWALKNRAATLGIAGVFFAGSLFLFSSRPQAFLPEFGEVRISTSVNLPDEFNMAQTDEKVSEYEQALLEVDGLGAILSEVGSSGGLEARLLGGSIDQSKASIDAAVTEEADATALTALSREKAEAIFGKDNVTVSKGSLTSEGFGGFALVASGDPELLAEFNDQAIQRLNSLDGLANVTSNIAEENTILRVDGEPAIRFTGELETKDSLGVTQAAKETLVSVAPPGVTISEGFESRQQTEGFAKTLQALMISVLAVYLVMVFTFKSFVHPFTILFSLPLAIIGAAVALWVSDSTLGISAMIGMMMLVGIVVTNAIVLVDRVHANRVRRGMNAHEALMEAGRTRLRPILMTAIAAILALVPLALGLSKGAIIASELAIVVIGGLTTSTLLTLVIVPVMYSLLDLFAKNGK